LNCGNCIWNWVTIPFIHVVWVWLVSSAPIRQTVSSAGADEEPDGWEPEVEPVLELELQPVIAIAAAAPIAASAAGVFLSPTCWHSFRLSAYLVTGYPW
jgi:hypothetical protein